MSEHSVDILGTKLDILIEDFQSHKQMVYVIMGSTILFVSTSVVAIYVATIK